MPTLRQLLAAKVALSLLASVALVFLPLSVLPWLGLPEYDAPALLFVRLLGAAIAALALVEVLGCFNSASLRAATVGMLAEMAGIALVVWHFVFYGYLATWPVLGKMVVTGGGVLATALALLVLVTGYRALAGLEVATPAADRP